MRKFLALPLALILTVVSTSGAFAHAELIKSFPAANSVQVKSPKYVQLEFGEALTTLKGESANTITILNSLGKQIKTRKISVIKGVARVVLTQALISGKYTVKYRVVSADGHVLASSYQFKLQLKS